MVTNGSKMKASPRNTLRKDYFVHLARYSRVIVSKNGGGGKRALAACTQAW